MSTSTTTFMNPDDPTVFPYISEEELARQVQPSITDEEFNAFLLSVSPHTTKFNLSSTGKTFPSDTNLTIDEMIGFSSNQNLLSDITTEIQPSLDSDFMTAENLTPQEFIVECGLDPAEFKSLQTPSPLGDSDTWNVVIHEMLDKMTEWAKTTSITLREMGVCVEDLQDYPIFD